MKNDSRIYSQGNPDGNLKSSIRSISQTRRNFIRRGSAGVIAPLIFSNSDVALANTKTVSGVDGRTGKAYSLWCTSVPPTTTLQAVWTGGSAQLYASGPNTVAMIGVAYQISGTCVCTFGNPSPSTQVVDVKLVIGPATSTSPAYPNVNTVIWDKKDDGTPNVDNTVSLYAVKTPANTTSAISNTPGATYAVSLDVTANSATLNHKGDLLVITNIELKDVNSHEVSNGYAYGGTATNGSEASAKASAKLAAEATPGMLNAIIKHAIKLEGDASLAGTYTHSAEEERTYNVTNAGTANAQLSASASIVRSKVEGTLNPVWTIITKTRTYKQSRDIYTDGTYGPWGAATATSGWQ